MIIKSTSRKSPSFSQLYDYITDELKREDDRYIFTHNTFGVSRGEVLRDFIDNSQRLSKRRGANYLYHEIISIKRDFTLDLERQKEILQDLAEQYSQTRAKRNLVFGAMHTDKEDNLHYHLMISANELGKNTRYRLTKKTFQSVKVGLEEYLLQAYPELKQDRVITKKQLHSGNVKSEKEYQSSKRTGEKSQKDRVKEAILDLISEPLSQKAFIFKCRDLGVEPYLRGGSYGVTFNKKKFRLKTLGLEEQFKKYERDYLLTTTEKNEEHKQGTRNRKHSEHQSTESGNQQYNQSYKQDYEDMTTSRSQRREETRKETRKGQSDSQDAVYNSEFERDYEDLKKAERKTANREQKRKRGRTRKD